MNKNIYKHIIFFLFVIAFLSSCSEKNNGEDITGGTADTYNIQYVIDVQKRVDINASDQEMMKSILLLIVNTDNTIERLIDVDLPELSEQYVVETELTKGSKTIYGFANLTEAMRTQAGINGLAEGDTMPDISNSTLTLPNGYEIDETTDNWLPMSNRVNYNVTNLTGQMFSMELVRLVSKISFHFTNETGYTVSLQELQLTPFTNSAIYLLPSDNNAPILPANTTQEDFIYPFGSEATFADKGELSYTVYVNETLVENSGWFRGILTTQREGQQTATDRFAITDLNYLRRNDYLLLNIILTDYTLELDVRAYPPIGGYPPLVTYEDEGYYCVFYGGGPFVITPTLIRQSDNTVIPTENIGWTFTYEDTNPSFFDEAPVLENGEITGIIKASASGSVLFTIQADIVTSENITRTLTYKVYIVQ